MINKIIIQGNLVADPELKHSKNGIAYSSFRLGWSDSYKDKKNELFINCVSWGSIAEFVSKYFSKGYQIIVEGRLISRSYEDETSGKKIFITELVVERCSFCGRKNTIENNKDTVQNTSEEDGDLPF